MGVSALPAGAGPQCPVAQRGRPGRPRAGRVLGRRAGRSAREQALSLRTGEGVGGEGTEAQRGRATCAVQPAVVLHGSCNTCGRGLAFLYPARDSASRPESRLNHSGKLLTNAFLTFLVLHTSFTLSIPS